MHVLKLNIAVLLLVLLQGCKVNTRPAKDRYSTEVTILRLRDSILQEGLDGEALYTLLGTIKPMSSVASFSFPLGNSDSSRRLDGDLVNRDSLRYLAKVKDIQRAIALIQLPDLKFVLVPYRLGYGKARILQLSVVRTSMLDSLLDAKRNFFGQYGFAPGTDPAVVVTVNEYEKKYERLRGYGYLFGYPDYAVDFFVNAFYQSDSTGKHVKRKFFQIPSYARAEGDFVYAYPEDHIPGQLDSNLYTRSLQVLEQYKKVRPKYQRADSSLRAYQLLQDLISR
jgi:hypothetical protein